CPRHHRFTPGGFHRVRDLGAVGCDDDPSRVRLDRTPPDVDDHRLSVDVGEGLSREPGRMHARRYDDESFLGHCARILLFGDKSPQYRYRISKNDDVLAGRASLYTANRSRHLELRVMGMAVQGAETWKVSTVSNSPK